MMRILKSKKVLFFVLLIVFFLSLYSLETIAFLFPKKVFAHRVNSLENLEAAASQFKGVELDITVSITPPYFDVNHPPAQSIGLSLETYLQKATALGITHFWFDVKNLNTSTALILNEQLPKLIAKMQIKESHCIVESTNPMFLQFLMNNGFKTSYYLPILNEKAIDNVVEGINSDSKNLPTSFFSTSFEELTEVKKRFKNKKYITWYGGTPHYSEKVQSRFCLYKILLDNDVEVILVPLHTKAGDR